MTYSLTLIPIKEKIIRSHQMLGKKLNSLVIKNFYNVYEISHWFAVEDLIKVDWFLNRVVLRDLDVQSLYFTRMPTSIERRDEDLFKKEGKESFEIISQSLGRRPHTTPQGEGGCQEERDSQEKRGRPREEVSMPKPLLVPKLIFSFSKLLLK